MLPGVLVVPAEWRVLAELAAPVEREALAVPVAPELLALLEAHAAPHGLHEC